MGIGFGLQRVAGIFLLIGLGLVSGKTSAQTYTATLTPAIVEAGSPELIRVSVPKATKVSGEWLGHRFDFFRGKNGKDWYALVGVDVETPAAPSTLRVVLLVNGGTIEIKKPVPIEAAHYRTEKITVEPKFVEPGPDQQAAIAAAVEAKKKAFATSATSSPDDPLWSGSFDAPVKAASTDSFGVRRTYNGKLASIHKGTDFRAATGTPVLAGNSGVVVLAQPLYFEGNCVMIDHGMGLMSISMHLSRIDVKPGQKIAKGEQVGLSGATGRVTGPHLHWAIRWDGSMLDAAKLLKMNLKGLP
jgi:murein DD-endopeptidase MepM/ murein hydrolase activator NlpD